MDQPEIKIDATSADRLKAVMDPLSPLVGGMILAMECTDNGPEGGLCPVLFIVTNQNQLVKLRAGRDGFSIEMEGIDQIAARHGLRTRTSGDGCGTRLDNGR